MIKISCFPTPHSISFESFSLSNGENAFILLTELYITLLKELIFPKKLFNYFFVSGGLAFKMVFLQFTTSIHFL